MKYFVSYQTMGMTIPPIMADERNLDPIGGIERLISGHGYKCRLCGSRPARLVVRLWEDGFRTRVPLCDAHLQASIAAFKQNTLDAANAAGRQPKFAPAEPDVLFDSTATGQRTGADEDTRPYCDLTPSIKYDNLYT